MRRFFAGIALPPLLIERLRSLSLKKSFSITDFFLYKSKLCGILMEHLDHGVLAQLVERQVRNLEARGSSPLCSTKTEATAFAAALVFYAASRSNPLASKCKA